MVEHDHGASALSSSEVLHVFMASSGTRDGTRVARSGEYDHGRSPKIGNR